MTDDQIKRGFWCWQRERNWPPESLTHFELYKPDSRLNLFITQLGTPLSSQNRIVKTWCDLLPTLTSVRYLWFNSRVNEQMFEAACNMKDLEGLYIKWSGIKKLDSLTKLNALRHLHIGSSAQIENIRIFRDINWLTTLELENLNKIDDFDDISGMTNLEGLGIDGSMWTGQKIKTLKPFGKLTGLKYLTLTNTKAQDKSFDPLLNLKELVRFYSSCRWIRKRCMISAI